MSSSRLMQQGDGLATLKELLTTLQHPEEITSAHETYRREIALTETEEKQVSEARALIKEHQTLLENLKAENAKHVANQNEMTFRESALQKGHEDLAAAVQASTLERNETVKALEADRKAFADQTKREDERLKNAQKGFDSQVAKFKEEKIAHEKEVARVAALEQAASALKAKYENKIAKLQAAAQAD